MDTWRCPTCLAVLTESGLKRCPQCQSRLRKGKPIVLGATSRLDRQAALVVDRQNKRKAERVFTPETIAPVAVAPGTDQTPPARLPEAILTDDAEPELVAIVEEVEDVAPAAPVEAAAPSFLELALAGRAVAPPPLPDDDVDTYIDTDTESYIDVYSIEHVEPEVKPLASFLDLALAEQLAPSEPADSVDLDAAIQGDDVTSLVDALHRKARGERSVVQHEKRFDPAPPAPEPEATPRSLRLMAPAASNRRRWNAEIKSRRTRDNV